MAFDEADVQRMRKAFKIASKNAAKKGRRAQRSIDERGHDDVDTRSLVEVSRLASAHAEELRKELESVERRLAQNSGSGEGSSTSSGEFVDLNKKTGPLSPPRTPSLPASLHSSSGEDTGRRFRCVDPRTGLDLAEGLVLHTDVISPEVERDLIDFVNEQCDRGRRGELRKPTYLRATGERSRGNNREAIMYGGFFDFNRARPGRRDLVPPFPPILRKLVRRLVDELRILPSDVRPDSVIINRYSEGDCIPPHVDHQSYYRPISTLSLLGEEPMLIGSRFKTVRACNWETVAGISVLCPRRSLLVLGGNSGNISKHCISACSGPRISITLRKQPPPDWKPDLSELVTNGKNWGETKKNSKLGISGRRDTNVDAKRKKSKPLSGSAKRRKKLAKLNAGQKL